MGLGETYKRILIRIRQSPSGAQLAQKMFKWATVAKRPLHIEEFKEAVAFDPSDKSWNEDKIPHEDRMFESCRGLIIKDADDQTVRFAHHTVPQYLTTGLSTTVDTFFEISTVEAETFAGQICVGYLLFSDFETQLTTAPLIRGNQGVLQSGGPLKIPNILGIKAPIGLPYRLLREKTSTRAPQMDHSKHLNSKFQAKSNSPVTLSDKYRLLQYVTDYWETHVRSFPTSSVALHRLALEKSLAFEFRPWGPNQHYGPHGCVGCPSPSTTDLNATELPYISMLHYAVEVGNMPLLRLLEIDMTLQQHQILYYLHHERYHDETLLIACRHGRTEIVKYLVDQGSFDITNGAAIYAAAAAGHANVLKFLLGFYGYSIERQASDMLLVAVRNGMDSVIDVLVEVGANPSAIDQRTGRSFLETAASNGHDSIIRALLGRGAHIDYIDFNFGRNALHLAATNGHAAAARALLESVPWPVDSRECALHAAARSGHSAVAEVLLEYDTDPANRILEIEGSSGTYAKTAFHVAAQNGHVRILELFKDHVQSVDSPRTTKELTALHVAAASSQDEVALWLVGNGADVNAIDLVGNTPLHSATSSGDETIVRRLLERGAMVFSHQTSPSARADTLTRAIRIENTTILELLLDNIREDRRILYEDKRRAIIEALRCGPRSNYPEPAGKVLVRELQLYPMRETKWKDFPE